MHGQSTLLALLRDVQHAFRDGSPEMQDARVMNLHDLLEKSPAVLFPSFLYLYLLEVLTYYCRQLLPALPISTPDQQFIYKNITDTIQRLQAQEQRAQELESECRQMLLDVQSGALGTLEELVAAFSKIVSSGRVGAEEPSRALRKQYQAFQKAPFIATSVYPFFDMLISGMLPIRLRESFANLQALFWHQVDELLQMKAVLVNLRTRQALVTRLDVRTSLEAAGLDDLRFENDVDATMFQSCWHALQAARRFLEDRFPGDFPLPGGAGVGALKDHSLRVTCRFPNPVAEYNDTSAGLLVGVKIVGDMLGLEVDPSAVMTGAVDEAGQVLPVEHVSEKVAAVEAFPGIQQIYLPHYGYVVHTPRITETPVHTFAEAVEAYYGEAFQKKQRWYNLLRALRETKRLFTFQNILTHPVSDQDRWNIEYSEDLRYSQGNYRKALEILTTLLNKFERSRSTSKDVLRIRAQIFGLLGGIYVLQNDVRGGLSCYNRAYYFWRSIRDREQQAATLLDIAVNCDNLQFNDRAGRNSKRVLHYFHAANELLRPSMKTFWPLRGKYYRRLGYFYYNVGEYETAENYTRTGLEYFDPVAANLDHQLTKRHLSTIFIKTGHYDEAYQILEEISQVPPFQSPIHQARIFGLLSELFFLSGDDEQGVQFFHQSESLCREFGLQIQLRALGEMVIRSGVLKRQL